jgi:hypothetical protein
MTLAFEPTDVELQIASEWYSGMGKLYAIASTGALSTGTRRPWRMVGGVWQDMTDDEWRLSLLVDLSRELGDIGSAAHLADIQGTWECDYPTDAVYDFENRVDDIIRELQEQGVDY